MDLLNNINDSLSYNFTTHPGTALQPIHPHGTYIAGIIGAVGNNNNCIAGTNWNTSLVSLRIDGTPNYMEDYSCFISSLSYAASNNIDIINFSGGWRGSECDSLAVKAAILNYPGLVICASGNHGFDISNSSMSVYPASFNLPNGVIVLTGADISVIHDIYSSEVAI